MKDITTEITVQKNFIFDNFEKFFSWKYDFLAHIKKNMFLFYPFSVPMEIRPDSVCPYPLKTNSKFGNLDFSFISHIAGTADPAGRILVTVDKSSELIVLKIPSYSDNCT